MELWKARSLLLSAGLGLWALGAFVAVGIAWFAQYGFYSKLLISIVMSAGMLAVSMAGVGRSWFFRRSEPDPLAQAWLLLTVYPLFAFIPVAWTAFDVGLIDWAVRGAATAVLLSVVLFLRGILLLSPLGPRAVAVDACRALPARTARRYALACGAAYACAGALAFAITVAGGALLGSIAALAAFIAILTGLRVLRPAESSRGDESHLGSNRSSTP